MKKQKILLAGATGYLGRFIVGELAKQEYPTRVIVRSPHKARFDQNQIEVVAANITEAHNLEGLFKDIDVVISTVGITRQKDGLTYMDVDYQANLNILNEAKKAGVKKFIYVSALNADKLTHLKMCAAKEKFVGALQNSGMDYCIIRPTGFFSDMTEFIKMAKKGTINLFDDGNYLSNPIHGVDLAEVCVDAIESREKTIEVGGPEVLSQNEIAQLAIDVVNKKAKIKFMPEWMRKSILWLARTFTSSKTYGPVEFFFTVLAMDMVAPMYGTHTLSEYYTEMKTKI